MRKAWAYLWYCYAGAWLLFGLLEVVGLHVTQRQSWAIASFVGVETTIPGALLGLLIGWLERRRRGARAWWRNVLYHLVASSCYSALWLVICLSPLALQIGWKGTWAYSQPFLIWQLQIGFIIYAIITSAFYAIHMVQRTEEEERRAREAEMLRVRAELENLRAKLQPHFLFNTLHSITALVRQDPVKAENALLRLGDVLRYVLAAKVEGAPDEVPLREEWKFVQEYLEIEKMRLAERLVVESSIQPEALDCWVPAFTLQPLVENALHHAIAPRARGGRVAVAAAVKHGRLEIEVADDGAGADLETVRKSPGFGLRVVRQRLETRYPGQVHFQIETEPNAGFRVRISLPATEVDV